MISPLQAHLNETITSLKFATKVYLEFLPLTSKANYSDRCTTRTLAQPRSKPKLRTKHLCIHNHLFRVSKRLNWAITYDITGVARKTRCWIPLEHFMYLLFFSRQRTEASKPACLLHYLAFCLTIRRPWRKGKSPKSGSACRAYLFYVAAVFRCFWVRIFGVGRIIVGVRWR